MKKEGVAIKNNNHKDADKWYIYKIASKTTNLCYIGETGNPIQRWEGHCEIGRKSNHPRQKYPLYQDMLKYGIGDFDFIIIEETTYSNRHDREEFWISYYDSYNNGYNNAPRQYVTSLGYEYTEERKQKYSEMLKGENNPFFGKHHTEETLEKLRKKGNKVVFVNQDGEEKIFDNVIRLSEYLGDLSSTQLRIALKIGGFGKVKNPELKEKYKDCKIFKKSSTTIEIK